MTAAAPGDGRWARVRVLVVLGALSAFGPLSMDLYLPALPRIASDLETPQSLAQTTMSACMAGLALGQLVAGPLSDSLGRRRPMLVGVAGYVVFSLVCAVAPNIGFLIAARLLQGIGGSAGLVVSRAVVRDLYGGGRNAARIFSLLMLVTGSAPIIAPILGAQLLRVTSWRGVFVVLASIGAAIFLGALTLRESHPAETRTAGGLRATGRAFGTLVRDRVFVRCTVAIGLASAALFVYISASPFVIEDAYGHSAQLFSVVFAVNSAGIMLASQAGARLVHRVGPSALLRAGLLQQSAAGLALLGMVVSGRPPLSVLLVPLFFVVSAVGLVLPNATALALSPHGALAGAASAFLGAFQFLVGGIMGPLSGVAGHSAILPMAVLIAALASGALLAGLPVHRARGPSALTEPVAIGPGLAD
jgi:DHA1 family bicyclomycin/chloramphenicol resistance-like MFS transporter